MAWRSFVAMGDSFTEGLDDPYPDGTFRGWADLVAARLAVDAGPDFGYANLAVRGRLLDQVLAEQLPATLAMRPGLVSLAAGGNDVLRRKADPAGLVAKVDRAVGDLRAAGADVVLFRFADVTANLPGQRIVGPRAAVLNEGAGEEWLLVPPMPAPTPWLLARRADLQWAGRHLAPWLKRRLIGASSGDLVTPKRPRLSSIDLPSTG